MISKVSEKVTKCKVIKVSQAEGVFQVKNTYSKPYHNLIYFGEISKRSAIVPRSYAQREPFLCN